MLSVNTTIICFAEDGKFPNTSAPSATNCNEIFEAGNRDNGVYGIIVSANIYKVYCEFERDGYNWMVKSFCLFKRKFLFVCFFKLFAMLCAHL